MPERYALRLSEEFFGAIAELTGAPPDIFGDKTYAIFTPISDTEFNIKLVTEDAALAEYANDSKLHVLDI